MFLFGGCSKPAGLGRSKQPQLHYASFSSKASDPKQLIESEKLRVSDDSAIRTALAESRSLAREKSAELTELQGRIDGHKASLNNTLWQLGFSSPQPSHQVSEPVINSAKQVARDLLSQHEAALEICRNEASRIAPLAQLESERYVNTRYDQIDHGIAVRNKTRAEIGARPADQAEAQARARKRIQARAAGQQIYVHNTSARTSANAKKQQGLSIQITSAKQQIQVLDSIPQKLLDSYNKLAIAKESARQLKAKIESYERTLRKAEALAEWEREQQRLAARETAARLVSANTTSYSNSTSRSATNKTAEPRQFAATAVKGSSGITHSGKTKSRTNTYASGKSYSSGRIESKPARYYDPSYRPNVGVHTVKGYTRKDGTRVKGHVRTNQDGSFWNNMSSFGNKNPYTGRTGTKLPPAGSSSGFGWINN